MESVGRAIARHGVSNKQRKTNREPKKQNYQGNDRHKAPGRIVSSGKKEIKLRSIITHTEGAFYLIVHHLHVQVQYRVKQ